MKENLSDGELKVLEKLFSDEIDNKLPSQFSKRNSSIAMLKGRGMVEQLTLTLGGRFPVTVKGWALTEYGRMTWCKHCSEHPL